MKKRGGKSRVKVPLIPVSEKDVGGFNDTGFRGINETSKTFLKLP
jgi:hypothetical protein